MTGAPFPSDDQDLAEQLRVTHRRTEKPPAAVVAAAVAAFRWKEVASAIAQVEFDSVLDEDKLARVRDMPGERRLRFSSAGRSVEVAVVENDGGLAGRVEPPLAGSIVLCHGDGSTSTAPLDEEGLFYFRTFKRGPVSFRPAPMDEGVEVFATEWTTL